ncbi:uncharacterized protein GlcG (DUF336 family) [Novosphingobium taihuense]|uniref:Uncharacterized protein GlcG (DUF336 family) n=2 Tax=Novosphingobium taihuense TaxID=260085 RepID=A0A7W7AFC1_9SPHN|nr:uncharacterized protein GlcG (DUF336 family) [Novosphingobium taihuense]
MAEAALNEADRLGCSVVVAVLDAGGHILLVQRGAGAPPASIEVARRKAETAVMFRMATSHLAHAAKENPTLASIPQMLPFEGGIPVIIDGHVAGAIGVSGALQHEDLACAEIGVAALGLADRSS